MGEDRIWIVVIRDTGTEMRATIINASTGNARTCDAEPYDISVEGEREEAIADLFAGPGFNIRDGFDKV